MKRLLNLLVALSVVSMGGFALPASDSFTGANLDPLSGNWAIDTGGFQITANAYQGTNGAGFNFARWITDAPGADQEASIRLIGAYTNSATGPCVHLTSSGNGYCLSASDFGGQDISIARFDGFANTNIGTAVFTSFAVNDVIKLRIVGSTLTPYKNGVAGATASSATYSAAGNGGIFSYLGVGGDDFLLDNVGGGGGGGSPTGCFLLLKVGCL